jgi:hypothetical protein
LTEIVKKQISTNLEKSDYERLEALVLSDQSTLALIARKAVLRGLPLVEAEVLGPQFAGKNVPVRKRKLAKAA